MQPGDDEMEFLKGRWYWYPTHNPQTGNDDSYEVIQLDGTFTIGEIRKIAEYMEKKLDEQ